MKNIYIYILIILIITACNNTENVTPEKQEKYTINKVDTIQQKK